MVGRFEEAIEVAEWCIEYDRYGDFIAPDGFEYIGDGAERIAFRSMISGFVYKKEVQVGDGSNYFEFENFLRVKDIPICGWSVPETELFQLEFSDIIAMEYVDGYTDELCNRMSRKWARVCTCRKPFGQCVAEVWEKPIGIWGISDINLGNVKVHDDGSRVLIDLGS
jgi:hypothetical protein